MGKQINEYVREQHGDIPWDRKSKKSEAGKGDVTRWSKSGHRNYQKNHPNEWKRPDDWPPNEADQ